MKRKDFLKTSGLFAFAVSTGGFIRYDGDHYIGDCETTSDILGPFYRPDSPERDNLVIEDEPGELIELLGTVRHDDCSTPYKNAKVELWHCDYKGNYDNTSDEYKYRGTTYTNSRGEYSFQTIKPVPYSGRPAHFHLMITAGDYQPLITQLYFSGDKDISNDIWASNATNRRLEVKQRNDGYNAVNYNVNMAPVLDIEPASLDKLTGVYHHKKNPDRTITFFEHNDKLWLKNDVFGWVFEYIGKNKFEQPGDPKEAYRRLHFKLLPSGSVKVFQTSNMPSMKEEEKSDIFLKEA